MRLDKKIFQFFFEENWKLRIKVKLEQNFKRQNFNESL